MSRIDDSDASSPGAPRPAVDPRLKSAVVLIVSPLAIVTWWYFGTAWFFREHLAGWAPESVGVAAAAGVYMVAATLVLMGLIPAAIVKLGFRENLADYGVRLGNARYTFRSFALLAPVMLVVAYIGSRDPAVAEYYPLSRTAGESAGLFGLHAAAYVLFYIGWEFHFRGFMQHALAGSMGTWNAVLVQAAVSALAHIGRPAAEVYGSLAIGLFWGALAVRTRSILSGFLQHALLGIALDWLICFGR